MNHNVLTPRISKPVPPVKQWPRSTPEWVKDTARVIDTVLALPEGWPNVPRKEKCNDR